MIETLDDIVEELANQIGIYEDKEGKTIRAEWEWDLKIRIFKAVEIHQKLYGEIPK